MKESQRPAKPLAGYPDLLTVYDLRAILRIGRKASEDLLRAPRIPIVKIGALRRISKSAAPAFVEAA